MSQTNFLVILGVFPQIEINYRQKQKNVQKALAPPGEELDPPRKKFYRNENPNFVQILTFPYLKKFYLHAEGVKWAKTFEKTPQNLRKVKYSITPVLQKIETSFYH